MSNSNLKQSKLGDKAISSGREFHSHSRWEERVQICVGWGCQLYIFHCYTFCYWLSQGTTLPYSGCPVSHSYRALDLALVARGAGYPRAKKNVGTYIITRDLIVSCPVLMVQNTAQCLRYYSAGPRAGHETKSWHSDDALTYSADSLSWKLYKLKDFHDSSLFQLLRWTSVLVFCQEIKPHEFRLRFLYKKCLRTNMLAKMSANRVMCRWLIWL